MPTRTRFAATMSLVPLTLLAALAACSGTPRPDSTSPTSTATPIATSTPVDASGMLVFHRTSGPGMEGEESIHVIDLDGAHDVEVHRGPGCCPRWSPDGKTIAMSGDSPDGRGTTGLVAPDGSGYRVLPLRVEGQTLICPTWSPDGRSHVCEAWNDDDPAKDGIWRIDAEGGHPRQLTHDRDVPASVSPDGQQILYSHARTPDEDSASAAYVMNDDGSDQHRITEWGFRADDWSRDGRWILLDHTCQDLSRCRRTLALAHPDGSGLREIDIPISEAYDAFEGSFSPDGRSIAFSMWLPSLSQDDIWTVDLRSHGLVQVTDTPEHEGNVDWLG